MLISLVHAHNPGPYTGAGNNTYLIGTPDAVLIDAGTGESRHLDDLATALAQHASRLAAVLVTHAHSDHASGAEAIAARWPGTRFFKMPWPERDAQYPVHWTPLADGERLAVGGAVLDAIHTPGHAPDHLAFWNEPTRTAFVGDLVTLEGTVMIPASHGGSLTRYLSSLRRIGALDAARFLPAHGPPIDDPRAVVERYLRHREDRERQILSAVQSGHVTLESIVDTVYDGLTEALRGAACESVLAHLIKLEEDEAVVREDGEWHATRRTAQGEGVPSEPLGSVHGSPPFKQ